MASFLIDHGSVIEAYNNDGLTPLLVAIEKNDKVMCKHLLKLGSNPNAKKSNKISALHLALGDDSIEIAELLIWNRALVDSSMLQLAVSTGQTGLAQLLLKNGADISTQDEIGDRIIDIAIRTRNEDMINRLLEYVKDIEVPDRSGDTLLHAAVRTGLTDVVRQLLRRGADKRARDKYGRTVLQRASLGQNLSKISSLCARGALKKVRCLRRRRRGKLVEKYK